MSEHKKPDLEGFKLDPGAFNAALFEAYKGDCNCAVCEILRKAIKGVLKPYLSGKGEK